MFDPVSIISVAGLGLKLIDQFRESYLRWRGVQVAPVSATVAQVKDELQVQFQGAPPRRITASDVKLDEWDQVAYDALEERVKYHWHLFYGILAKAPSQSVDETERLEYKMNQTKTELCKDFRQMVRIYERVFGVSLPDHYQLHEVCG